MPVAVRKDGDFFSHGLPGLAGSRLDDGRDLRCFSGPDADNALIGDFPAEGFHLAMLIKFLFEKNRPAGIGSQRPGSREEEVPRPILHLDTMAQKGGVTRHVAKFGKDVHTGQ